MIFIPQELVDSIISKLDDIKSLKACCLAGPMFRDPCQQILLRSITLTCWPKNWAESPNFGAACILFEESPHVAAYIKHLKIILQVPPARFDSLCNLQQVLEKLVNVRWCMVTGHYRRLRWSALTPGLSAAFLHFFSQQSLRELHLQLISGIPSAAFRRPAPFISFQDVSIDAEDASQNAGTIENLVLNTESRDVYAFLACPQHQSHIAGLRRLSIDPNHDETMVLIVAAANTLQHIHFSCNDSEVRSTIPLPVLPALQFIEVLIGFSAQRITGVLDTITSILTSGASFALAEIVLTFRSSRGDSQLPRAPDTESMAALDAALTVHPAAPLIRWRVNFALKNGAEHFATFSDSVRRQMLHAETSGQLVIEEYRGCTQNEFGDEWPFRRA
ncbi:hypothetical protein C8R44DRAFT_797140 [Mycena epipterygia]|nr:hypothetical protein C8R44DRAFT_797140 [Mycena epipterygia]